MKNYYKKRGISLVALTATVVVMLVLITTVTFTGFTSINNARKREFATEISMLNTAVKTYFSINKEYPTTEAVVLDLSQIEAHLRAQFSSNGENIQDTKVALYEIDYNKINMNNLRYGRKIDDDTDIYLLSKDTGNVYYAKGLNIGSDTYFTLTSDLSKMLNREAVEKADGLIPIVFEPTSVEYTKEPIGVQVKVPYNYDADSIQVTKGTEVIVKEGEGTDMPIYNGYYVYNVTPDTSNYAISVTATCNGVACSGEYQVKNYDATAPDIQVETLGTTGDDADIPKVTVKDGKATVNILNFSDNLSGINMIKYETNKIEKDIREYFENNGKNIKYGENKIGGSITVPDTTDYITLFIKDNAKNYKVIWIPLSGSKSNALVIEISDTNLSGVISGQIADITDENLASITSLNASSKNIVNLKGLDYAVNMVSLNLSNNKITDISPLSKMTKLETLNLSNNQVSDISIITNLKSLKNLNLATNKVINTNSLKSLTNLESLDISVNDINDLSNIASLTTLKSLTVTTGTNLPNINALQNLGNLEELTVYEANDATLNTVLLNFPLRSLSIKNSSVTKLPTTTELQITSLTLSSNTIIPDISNLNSYSNLEYLDLTNNKLTSLPVMTSLTKLKTLKISGNSITNYTNVKNIPTYGNGLTIDITIN